MTQKAKQTKVLVKRPDMLQQDRIKWKQKWKAYDHNQNK